MYVVTMLRSSVSYTWRRCKVLLIAHVYLFCKWGLVDVWLHNIPWVMVTILFCSSSIEATHSFVVNEAKVFSVTVFVSISTTRSAAGTQLMIIWPFYTFSIKKQRLSSMCFIRECCTWFSMRTTTLMLSHHTTSTKEILRPRSFSKDLTHKISLTTLQYIYRETYEKM